MGLTAFDGTNSGEARFIACFRAQNSEDARASVPHRLCRLVVLEQQQQPEQMVKEFLRKVA